MNKETITIIIPIHEFDETTKKTFEIAIQSVINQKVRPQEVILVVPTNSEAKEHVLTVDFGDIKDIVRVVDNDGKTDFASQVNFGVSKTETDWFSILEVDDEISSIWLKNVHEYIQKHPKVDIFLPLIVYVDANGTFTSLTNEAVWAQGFSDETGYLDLNSLLVYQNFNTDGMVMRKSIFKEDGGFKPSIKLTFIYEFLLRMCFKDIKTMVIPKFGYKHMNMRPGGLFDTYKKELEPTEAQFWLAQAKKEYYFDKDRGTTYEKTT